MDRNRAVAIARCPGRLTRLAHDPPWQIKGKGRMETFWVGLPVEGAGEEEDAAPKSLALWKNATATISMQARGVCS